MSQVLQEIVETGQVLGFIDGRHTFDHVLLDFFCIDRMLEVGGIIVFDDVRFPAMRRLCEFLVTNRAYEICGSVKRERRAFFRERTRRHVLEILRPLYRADRTPKRKMRGSIARPRDVCSLALRKTADDQRRWDPFVQF